MREILLILSMLVLGLFSAKAFGAYIPTTADTELLIWLQERVYNLWIQNPNKIDQIKIKLPVIIDTLSQDTQSHYILSWLLTILENTNMQQQQLSKEMINILATQFK